MINSEFYTDIPCYNNGIWETVTFDSHNEFRDYVLTLFKEPGKYQFNDTSLLFNEQALKFRKDKRYCDYIDSSKDFISYWDNEKEKCRKGCIFKDNKHEWYLPRDYYMWINYLPINLKDKGKLDFVDVWDSQYHLALYELLAELHFKQSAVVKKRQFGVSFYHTAKLINQIWFEESVILKMGGTLKTFVENSWKFLEEYRSFLNNNTAWYRPMNPGKEGKWQQQVEVNENGKKWKKGLKGSLEYVTFDKSPTSGVGGAIKYFFHEESGVAPKMDKTVQYMIPAMTLGMITTGMFIAAGSVGELKDCEPLRKMIYYPKENSVYPVTNNLMDENGSISETGLFIPVHWSMPPYIDRYGNSLVDEALEAITVEMEIWKKEITSPSSYQLKVSQNPRYLSEAFDYREESKFPLHLVKSQQRRIEDKQYPYETIDLKRNDTGGIEVIKSNKLPIEEFPIKMTLEDKRGIIVVWERPEKELPFLSYFASVDPVNKGKTNSSESLCSIFVYKRPINRTRHNSLDKEVFVEKDKIVCSWTGRFDDIKDTNERLEMIIEWYNAWTLVESNVPTFITYMIGKNKQKYLVPKNQFLSTKDLTNAFGLQEYGWYNSGTTFEDNILPYYIEYLSEIIDTTQLEDGSIMKKTYGIERIPDIMVIKEMIAYRKGLNVDRLIAIVSLIAFAKIQLANIGASKVTEYENKNLEKTKNMYKLNTSAFRHVGNNNYHSTNTPNRNPFKNLK